MMYTHRPSLVLWFDLQQIRQEMMLLARSALASEMTQTMTKRSSCTWQEQACSNFQSSLHVICRQEYFTGTDSVLRLMCTARFFKLLMY